MVPDGGPDHPHPYIYGCHFNRDVVTWQKTEWQFLLRCFPSLDEVFFRCQKKFFFKSWIQIYLVTNFFLKIYEFFSNFRGKSVLSFCTSIIQSLRVGRQAYLTSNWQSWVQIPTGPIFYFHFSIVLHLHIALRDLIGIHTFRKFPPK